MGSISVLGRAWPSKHTAEADILGYYIFGRIVQDQEIREILGQHSTLKIYELFLGQ
jgi:hypothetical protein